MKSKKAQVWVETVIYTLIAFSLIGIALSMVKPKIESMQDRTILDQTFTLLQEIDNKLFELEQTGISNKRKFEITIKKGILNIDSINDAIIFELENTPEAYSEPGINITNKKIKILTEKKGDLYKTTIRIDYSEIYNITFQGKEESKLINPSPRAHTFFIENQGYDEGNPLLKINFEVN